MERIQDALHLEQLRKEYLAKAPGAEERLARALDRELRAFLRSPDADEIIQESRSRRLRCLLERALTPLRESRHIYLM